MAAGQADPEVQPLAADPQAVLAAVHRSRQLADGDLVEVGTNRVGHRAPSIVAVRERWAWTNWTAIAPSPTAVAQRLVEPERTLPAANTPEMSVSSRWSVFAAVPVTMKPSGSRATVSPSHSVHGSAPRNRNRNENERRSPLVSVTASTRPPSPWSAAISLPLRTATA